MHRRRLLLTTLLALASALQAQTQQQLAFQCTAEDIDALGLSCTEDEPCPVFLEITSIEAVGVRLLLAGNFHTDRNTLYSVVLSSEDNGQTWKEPHQRIRGAAIDHIQFIDFQYGFMSGGVIGSLPRDSFLLTTSDGGKTWRDRPLFDEGRIGTIAQFHFDSKSNGLLVFDRTKRPEDGNRYELLETMTGGDTWIPKQYSAKPLALKTKPLTPEERGWRIREDSKSKTIRIEQKNGPTWTVISSFPIRTGECRPPEPKPTPSATEPPQ
ncbi:hypothetical protein F183_A35040 [Bryobacterales bacterium F-183]|nr:hypothetical protein F183_A35040 [Bryobacterales bacterium F-183]